MAGKFVINKATNGKFHFVLKASNGEVILASQLYMSIEGAKKGIASVRENCAKDERFVRLASKKNEPYFNLKAGNGQAVGKSEMYTTEKARENGISSVKRNAPDAKVDNTTAA
jgi:uncharacterized protein